MKKTLNLLFFLMLAIGAMAQQKPVYERSRTDQVLSDRATWSKYFLAVPTGPSLLIPSYVPDSIKKSGLFVKIAGGDTALYVGTKKIGSGDTISLSTRINSKANKTTTFTINGTTYDLSDNRSWTITNITGNSGTVTNGVYTNGSYSNPPWITSLAWSKITTTPTTISAYGITDAYTKTQSDGKYLQGNGTPGYVASYGSVRGLVNGLLYDNGSFFVGVNYTADPTVTGKMFAVQGGGYFDGDLTVNSLPSGTVGTNAIIVNKGGGLFGTIPGNSYQTALGFTPESVANKSTSTTLGTSNSLYPTQNAVKTYVDNAVTGVGGSYIPKNSTTTPSTGYSFNIDGNGQFGGTVKIGNYDNTASAFSVSYVETAGNNHSFESRKIFNITGGTGTASFDARDRDIGTSNRDHMVGYQYRNEFANTGLLLNMTGFWVFDSASSGTINSRTGMKIQDISKSGTAVITTNIGLSIDAHVNGGTNYNILSAGGRNAFTGTVKIGSGGASNPTENLYVIGASYLDGDVRTATSFTTPAIIANPATNNMVIKYSSAADNNHTYFLNANGLSTGGSASGDAPFQVRNSYVNSNGGSSFYVNNSYNNSSAYGNGIHFNGLTTISGTNTGNFGGPKSWLGSSQTLTTNSGNTGTLIGAVGYDLTIANNSAATHTYGVGYMVSGITGYVSRISYQSNPYTGTDYAHFAVLGYGPTISGKWNSYFSTSDNNYFGTGETLINTTTTDGTYKLKVNGAAQFTSVNASGLLASLPVFTDALNNLTNTGPGTNLQVILGNGGLGTYSPSNILAYRSVNTSSYTATTSDMCINVTGASSTISLPATPNAGQSYIIKNSGSGSVTVNMTGGSSIGIDGSPSITLANGVSYRFTFTGTNYYSITN